jgi:hypothetical protein
MNTIETPNDSGEGRSGPLIGTIVVIVIIALGGLYFWGSSVDKALRENTDTGSIMEDESLSAMRTQSDSTDIASIEADLNATDLSDLDRELTDINLELEAR